MSSTFTAQVRGWSEKAKRNMELVVKGSAADVIELMSRRIQGVSVGGTFQHGFVPVGETSGLVNSLGYALNSPVSAGGGDYTAALVGMKVGDTIEAAYTIEYARFVEYGTSNMPGRFMVRSAVQQWQTVVDSNARLFKD